MPKFKDTFFLYLGNNNKEKKGVKILKLKKYFLVFL